MKNIKRPVLYLVISEEYANGRNAEEVAERAIAGGVDMIQMREKSKPKGELIALGKRLSGLCRDRGVMFIVNDDPALAKEVDADGVHLGQEDCLKCSPARAREVLGAEKIIGVSTHSLEEFMKANEEECDYAAFGPIFSTKTKNYFLGTARIEEIAKAAKKPVIFIGGIKLSNIGEILKRGGRNIALIRGITAAEDITAATREFKKIMTGNSTNIRINGKPETIKSAASLKELISGRGLIPEHIVVEHNEVIVPKEEWDRIVPGDNDKIEIISFVGGG